MFIYLKIMVLTGRNSLQRLRLTIYSCKVFGSIGRGYVLEDMEYSHYMKDFNARVAMFR
jgi:hypothetical protein